MNEPTFSKLLTSVILDNKYDRHVKGKKSGKLDTRSLYKVNHSIKLFKRREERKNKDYVVSIVIDCSSSMGGSKIRSAAHAAESLSKNFANMGIMHSIVLFSSSPYEIRPFSSERIKDVYKKCVGFMGGYVYFTKILPEHKQWKKEYANGCRIKCIGSSIDTTFSQAVKKYGVDSKESWERSQGGTLYAPGIATAIETIKKQKGKKIVITLSDGDTAHVSKDDDTELQGTGKKYGDFIDIKKMVNRAIKDGIEVYSVCIEDDHANQYFPPRRTCSVYDIGQLYDHIVKMIKINLKRG